MMGATGSNGSSKWGKPPPDTPLLKSGGGPVQQERAEVYFNMTYSTTSLHTTFGILSNASPAIETQGEQVHERKGG